MRGRIVHVPRPDLSQQPDHACRKPWLWMHPRWPLGTVWECDCGRRWTVAANTRDDGRWWRRCLADEYDGD